MLWSVMSHWCPTQGVVQEEPAAERAAQEEQQAGDGDEDKEGDEGEEAGSDGDADDEGSGRCLHDTSRMLHNDT